MKKILLLLLIASVQSYAQTDSAKIKPTVVLKAKDLLFINSMLLEKKYKPLDSLISTIYLGVQNPPGDNTDITITVLHNKAWYSITELLRSNNIALQEVNNILKRVLAALRLAGQSYLTKKLDNDDADLSKKASDIVDAEKLKAKGLFDYD